MSPASPGFIEADTVEKGSDARSVVRSSMEDFAASSAMDRGELTLLIEQALAFSRQHGARSLTVMVSVAVPDALVSTLLDDTTVKSVILATKPDNLSGAYPGRIGWLRPCGRLERAPLAVGELVIVFGEADAFGFELVKLSLRLGARRVTFDTPFGFTQPASLWLLFADRCGRGLGRKLRRKIRNVMLSGRFKRLDPLLTRCYRRLMKPLVTSQRDRKALACLRRQIAEMHPAGRAVPGRLVFVTGSLGPGGAERQLVNTITGLSARGYRDMHLLADRLSPAPHDFYRPKLDAIDGLSMTELASVSTRQERDILELDRLACYVPDAFRTEILQLMLLFKRLQPAVVHAWQDSCCAKAGLAAVLVGVDRVVLSWRSLSPLVTGLYHPCYEPLFQVLAARDNVVMLNNSEAGAKSYAAWLGLSRKRLQVIRNGVDFAHLGKPDAEVVQAYRSRLGIPAAAPVLGTVFRFGEEKRPMLWLQAAARVAERRPDVHFLMVGDGPLFEPVEAAAREWGLEARVHLPGRTASPALAFAAMDLFLLTSVFEGFPNVIVEAGAMGVPVITTDVGGVREAFAHEKTGFAVAASTPGPLADKIVELLADDAWRSKAQRMAPGWVRTRFGMDRMIGETLEAFQLRPDPVLPEGEAPGGEAAWREFDRTAAE